MESKACPLQEFLIMSKILLKNLLPASISLKFKWNNFIKKKKMNEKIYDAVIIKKTLKLRTKIVWS